jgi:hypothetical protein
MARIAPEKANFFVRSNYAVGVEREDHAAAAKKHSSMATQGLIALTEQAIARITDGVQAEAGLRELWASLVELRHLRASDPGIRMAAQDLYEAAAAVAMQKRAGVAVVDIRLWRLLKQADGRLKARVALMEHGQAKLSGLARCEHRSAHIASHKYARLCR